ncbi:MAG: hypothetical protein A2Z21_09600 [Candidatus Fraserbacteria bacterium RBG_16_55_9]|uniref:Uncharacterized protein n=1 Tax=Fraserbacteria sp. (strain RBG_16_55_9) TaxID=1817864 RepID=A0A1F5UPT4_FRAXR|nr:MAG: hypothetical protein A2Z21_09600 [Candidatus Fraserbacteria bacterium RBG_16_55_9]
MFKKLPMLLGLLAVSTIVVGGCDSFQMNLERSRVQSIGTSQPGTLDDLFAEVASRVPAFGGMFLNEQNSLYVYLLDPTQKAAVEAALVAVFGPELLPADGIQVLQGQYSFTQLQDWYVSLPAVLSISGVTLTDIDEAKNRLRIGVETMKIAPEVEQALARLAIPQEAVILEETGAITPAREF